MSSVLKSLLTPQEYLAKERKAEYKSEYYRGETFAIERTNWNHAIIKSNLARETGNQLEKTPCFVLTSDMRIKVDATASYWYPDILIVCEKPQFEDDQRDTLLNPRGLVEVLSNSTEKFDRGVKIGHYRQIASLQEYVLIAQNEPLAERYLRQTDGRWLLTEFRGLTQTFALSSIPVEIALSDIYRGVEFPENAGR